MNPKENFFHTVKGYAGESVETDKINDTYYAYGSEIATLRILKAYKYAKPEKINQGFTHNLNTWYFSLTTN